MNEFILKEASKKDKLPKITILELLNALEKIPGGYVYSGSCSHQVCFPLKNGGELRFSIRDSDMAEENEALKIDLYSNVIQPCVTGPSILTGKPNLD